MRRLWLVVFAVTLVACSQSSSVIGRPTIRPSVIVDGHLHPCPESTDVAALPVGGLPDISLPCLDPGAGSQQVRLAGVRGKPMVVTVWASWCVPCREEMPLLVQADASAAGSVLFLGVDVLDQPDDAKAFDAALHVRFNSVQDVDGTTKQSLGWIGPPILIFVDATGRIAGRHIGAVADGAELRTLLVRYLQISVK